MAKIRLRMGPCEVEIESGNFYVDNDTASAAIDSIAASMQRVAAPRAQVLAAAEDAAAAAGTADACSGGVSASGRAALSAGGSRPMPPTAAAASTAAAAPLAEEPPTICCEAAPAAAAAQPPQPRRQCPDLSSVLDCLDEAEVFEPEFDEPRRVPPSEVAPRLRTLAAGGFFGEPRTVTETVDAMAERGWLAGPLDVSKALARMSMGREMHREARGYKVYYCAPLQPAAAPPRLSSPAAAPVSAPLAS